MVAGLGTRPGVKALPCTELAWWEPDATSAGVAVTFVPSQHWSRRGADDTNETLWGGFVDRERSDARVYHSGDTAYFDGFPEIGRRFPGIDAALLPIGAYDPRVVHAQAAHEPRGRGARVPGPRARGSFVAMHWGTFKLTDEPLDEPPRLLRAEWERRKLSSDALSILPIGGSLELRGSAAARTRQPAS